MVAVEEKERTAQTQIHPAFARHETFPPRNGWLKKGFDGLQKDPEIFGRDDCAVILGVGKNMAKSIRYWCLAFKLFKEVTEEKKKVLRTTDFGQSLLAESGWDPYLEDPGSLWLLHWKLLQAPCLATTWYFAFNHSRHAEFSQDDFQYELSDFARKSWPDSEFAAATLKNDISCFARMYCGDEVSKGVSEETISSPFTDLGLLTKMSGAGKHIAVNLGYKANLPSEIIAFAALEFVAEHRTSEISINLSRLSSSVGSPGMVFKISESCIYSALEEVALKRKAKDLKLSETAGITQLQFLKDPTELASQILESYYGR